MSGESRATRIGDELASCIRELRRARSVPFAEQCRRIEEICVRWRDEDGPPPVWRPDEDQLAHSNMGRFMRERGVEDYRDLHRWSVDHRAEFWECVIDRMGVAFSRAPSSIIGAPDDAKCPRWLPGAAMNCVDSCFNGDPDRTAIVSGREGSEELETVTYGELNRMVDRVARGIVAHGFAAHDAIALYMPMTVECVAAYLGIIRAGCAAVSIADSFSPAEVRRRLQISNAHAVVTVERFSRSGKSIDLYEKVRAADAPRSIVIPAERDGALTLRDGDILWSDVLGAEEPFESVVGDPYDVINVLFSSGTTGDPKAIPWTHLTPLKCAMDGYFHQDVRDNDVVAWPTNIGWMMGPWLIFASLINGATMALYQGAPGSGGFVRFVQRAGVSILGTVPSLVRAWRSSELVEDALWSGVRVFTSTGEPSSWEDYLWLMSRAGYRAPVIEYCGGTEIGGGYVTGSVVQPACPATFATPTLGLDLTVLNEGGSPVGEGGNGEVFLIPPSIGLSERLLNQDHDAVYYDSCPRGPQGQTLRRHGDEMVRLGHGYYKAQGRADDTMNLGGIKVSSLELERVVETHDAVYESAAVAVQVGGEGPERLVVFVVPRAAIDAEQLTRELGAMIAREINPLFKIHQLIVADALPRTASNKLMRRELRKRCAEAS